LLKLRGVVCHSGFTKRFPFHSTQNIFDHAALDAPSLVLIANEGASALMGCK
jgi:hypothetical protein